MEETQDSPSPKASRRKTNSPWRITGWLCAGVVAVSVLSCLVMAGVRSKGLVKITVTALDAASEPSDHILPFFKKKEALPDYELSLILGDNRKVALGAKPDTSAVNGLIWHVNDPVSITDVASVRLREQDKILSDSVAEVQVQGESTTQNGFRFDFVFQRSISVGVKSFFRTPIGKAISTGFCIAVIVMLLSLFRIYEVF